MVSWTTNYSSTAVDGKQIQLNPMRKLACILENWWLVQMIHFLLRNVLVFSGSTFVYSRGVMCQTFKLAEQPQNQSPSITQLLRDLHPGLCHCGGQFFRGGHTGWWKERNPAVFPSRVVGSWNFSVFTRLEFPTIPGWVFLAKFRCLDWWVFPQVGRFAVSVSWR